MSTDRTDDLTPPLPAPYVPVLSRIMSVVDVHLLDVSSRWEPSPRVGEPDLLRITVDQYMPDAQQLDRLRLLVFGVKNVQIVGTNADTVALVTRALRDRNKADYDVEIAALESARKRAAEPWPPKPEPTPPISPETTEWIRKRAKEHQAGSPTPGLDDET